MGEEGVATANLDHAILPEQAVTLDGLLRERVKRTPDAIAYRDFNQQHANWRDYTWAQIDHHVGRFQAALEREELQPGDRVALMLRNSPEWVVYDQAAFGLGLVVVPLHMQDGADNVAYILRDAGCKVLLVGSLKHWRALENACAGVESLKRIVTLESLPPEGATDIRLKSLDEWLPDDDGATRHLPRDPKVLATVIYTSGTTGRPKGVMLSHYNILSNAYAGLQVLDLHPTDELLSFLPMSHAFERTCGYYLTMMLGITVAYARSIQQLGEDLRMVRPTALMSVPRVYELVYGTIHAKLEESPFRRKLFELAARTGYARFEHAQGRAPWRLSFLLWPLLDRLVARKVRARLGGRLRCAFSGGAALPPRIARIFIGLGVPIIQGYGLTETSPIACANLRDSNIPASIGPPIPGVEVKLDAISALLIRGPNIMLGYWNNPAATAAVIDADGWFNSGDIARIDDAGHVYITGRLKEILVMSNGEKIPPMDIESAILRDSLFSQVMLVGEGKPCLGLFAVLNREHWSKIAAEKGCAADNLSTKLVQNELLARIAAQMKEFPGYGHVRRVTAMFEPWTIEVGLLTPTLKLRRGQIMERYRNEFEKMYAGFEICKDAPL
jgi:long-chain acyl-CoA synthetase